MRSRLNPPVRRRVSGCALGSSGISRRLLSWFLVALAGPAYPAFEITGGGARSAGLGGAFTAGVDVEAVWFNPAANARAQKLRVGTAHTRLYSGLDESPSLSVLGVVLPVGGGSLQLGWSSLGGKDWREQVGIVGYGRALHQRVALGTALRCSGWKTSGLSHRVWSADLGGIYEVGWVRNKVYIRLGLMLTNIKRANIAASGDPAGKTPRGLVLAASANLGRQQVLMDLERRGGRTEFRAGYESPFSRARGLAFRLGGRFLPSDREAKQVDVGLGYRWNQWHFNYAYSHPLHPTGLGGIHRAGFEYRGH